MILSVLGILFPVVLLLALGATLRFIGFFDEAFASKLLRLGVPVLSLATAGTATGEETMRVAMLTLAAYSILCNVGAVLLLAGSGCADCGADGAPPLRRRIGRLAAEMAANPLIVGSLVGLALLALRRGFGVMLPAPVVKTMSLLGAMATPAALLALGASLTPERLRAALRPAALAVAFKLVLCPLLGAAAVAALALPPAHRLAVLVYLACPCSTSSYIMDEAMGGDAELSGAAVVLSTVLCAVSIAAVLLLQ